VLELLKSATFWSAVGAIATLAGVGAIFYASRQLRFEAWLKAQEIWVLEEFVQDRGKVFARLDNLEQPWLKEDRAIGLRVCRRVDEFVRLAPYLGRRRMLAVWGDPLAKAWIVLHTLVDEERKDSGWQTKWDAFEKLGRKALSIRPDLKAKYMGAGNRGMGRIRQTIKVDGQECWTLFDTGARNTYVTPSVAQVLKTSTMPRAFRTALGGAVRETKTAAILEAEIQNHPISTHALVIDEIGKDEDGRSIEILFGALAMQQWGIRPVPDEERLDLTHYPEEFVEF